jgi:hypothetical protein
MNASGDTVFTRKYGAPNDAAAYDICETSDGSYLWVGKLKISARYNVYFYKIYSNGFFNFASTFGGLNGDDEGKSVSLCSDNGFIVAGNSNSFNNGLGDAYVFKTDMAGVSSGVIINNATGIDSHLLSEKKSLILFPNPADNNVIINFGQKLNSIDHGTLNIYDQLGRIIIVKELDQLSDFITIDLSEYNNGMYFVNIVSGNQKLSAKLIVEHP